MTEVKIGIVTYWKSTCNYGEQLQNYALQEYLRRQGHDPFLIRYDYENDTIYGSRPLHVRIMRACNPKRLFNHFKVRKNNKEFMMDNLKHPREFEGFRDQHLVMSRVYSSIDDLRNDPPEADMYITGSDQVWNTFDGGLIEMRNRLRAFFLDFGLEKTKRISYAASWGRYSVPNEEKEFIAPLLSRFNAISVREKNGIEICRQLGRDDAVLSLDPVLLHDAEVYRKLYRENGIKKHERKYVLFYYMNNDGKYNRKAVFDWATSKNLEIIYVTDDWHDELKRSFPSVTEWLDLIDNAEYVITNSYHCVLFSLLFAKRFGVIKRFGKYEGMNARMNSLFDLFGIEPRFIDTSDFGVLERPEDELNIEMTRGTIKPEEIIMSIEEQS